MFSMKYTSPKVTPKKVAPSTTTAASIAVDALTSPSSSSASGSAGPSATATADDHNSSCEKSRLNIGNLANGFTGEDFDVRSQPNCSEINQRPTSLTKANLSNSDNNRRDDVDHSANNDSLMSENDSAVANIFEQVQLEPRSNLLALLDREYANSSSSWEGSSEKLPQISENNASSDNKDHDVEDAETSDCGTVDDENIEIGSGDAGRDREDVISDSSSIHLAQGYSLQETSEGSFEYMRSTSMEAVFDESPEESSLHSVTLDKSSAEEEGSVEVTPIVEQSGSIRCPNTLDSEETMANDARSVSPTLDRGEHRSRSSPTIYDMSAAIPASPIMSEINADRFGGESLLRMDSPARSDAATESEIGGDTYFNQPVASCLEGKKPRADSIDSDNVPLPPRVNRTTNTPFLTNCPSTPPQCAGRKTVSPLFPKQKPLPIASPRTPFSPRQPHSHTHSLLDDCSDEEDEVTSFRFVDSPIQNQSSYSCLPRPRSNSEGGKGATPFSSYFKNNNKQKQRKNRHSHLSAGTSANQVASNNIQQALLQTRHRRWDCQSAYSGPHAQSNRVFDLSHRAYHVAGRGLEEGDGVRATRLSVSKESVRAAALASGLWRTVKLVRLPKGLFWSKLPVQRGGRTDGNEVWALLKMLHSTFPNISQIDFGGDISKAMKDSKYKTANGDDWTNEILSCIMECLPNIVAIDGFVVEQDSGGAEPRDEKSPTNSEKARGRRNDASNNTNSSSHDIQAETNAVESASACVECDSVPMCGLSELVESETQNDTSNASRGDGASGGIASLSTNMVRALNNAEEITSFNRLGQYDDTIEDVSENIMTIEETLSIQQDPWCQFTNDEIKETALSSSSDMLSSSRSWGSNGSGTRPPTCPNLSSRQRSQRLPTKPTDRKNSKGSFTKAGARLKRRVLGLIPSVSMMDEDEDDEDSDDSENVVENDCPTDLL